MEPVPLDAEDRAILALESDTVAGHTCKVVRLDGTAPDLDALRRGIARRIERVPALTRRLGGSDDAPAWVEAADFELADHVVAASCPAPLDPAALRAEVARLFSERLDRSRPLWQIDVAPLAGGSSALVWRIHHALADGTAAMRFAHDLLWDTPSDTRADARGRPEGSAGSSPSSAGSGPSATGSGSPADGRPSGGGRGGVGPKPSTARNRPRPSDLAGFLRRELPLDAGRSPFDGHIGGVREVAFALVPLHPLHDAAKHIDGASLNDAVLAIVAGALQRWLETHHAGLGSVRVKVPVSLHHPGDDVGNRDSAFTLPLPLGEPDPVARLDAVHAATSGRKQGHDAETLEAAMRELGRVSPRLRAIAERIEDSPRGFALSVSNVPGPRDPVSVLGTPVTSLHSIAEIGERHALRVAVVSLAGQLAFGLCADPGIVPDVQLLADGLEAEAAALIEAAPADAAPR